MLSSSGHTPRGRTTKIKQLKPCTLSQHPWVRTAGGLCAQCSITVAVWLAQFQVVLWGKKGTNIWCKWSTHFFFFLNYWSTHFFFFTTVYNPSYQTRAKTFGRQCFSYCAPKQWNSLHSDIHHIISSQAFKTALKTHLYKLYHNKWFQILSSHLPPPHIPSLTPRYLPSVYPLCVCVYAENNIMTM